MDGKTDGYVNFARMEIEMLTQSGTILASLLEITAVIFGLISVWLMKKERVAAFPFGIVNVLIYVYIFSVTKLYANAGINAYFFLMSVYGWYNWSRKDHEKQVVRITRCSINELIINVLLIFILFGIIRVLLVRYTNSEVPSWDAATTAVYMVAQWLLARKKIENWILWISADVVMVGLCVWQGLYFTSIQYLVFTVIATLGFREWMTKLRAWSEK